MFQHYGNHCDRNNILRLVLSGCILNDNACSKLDSLAVHCMYYLFASKTWITRQGSEGSVDGNPVIALGTNKGSGVARCTMM